MNIEELREYCLSLKGVEEGFPFDQNNLVFSVRGKMFCATNVNTFEFINVKCDPDKAIQLREQYEDVTPGYYMNKAHWNSVKTTGKLSDAMIQEWISDSYHLVVASLPKKIQKELIG